MARHETQIFPLNGWVDFSARAHRVLLVCVDYYFSPQVGRIIHVVLFVLFDWLELARGISDGLKDL